MALFQGQINKICFLYYVLPLPLS